MELADLHPEDDADQPADQRAQNAAADDVQRVMDADIYLRVRNDKGPEQDERPPATNGPERPVDEDRHSKVITGVGRGEAGTDGAIARQEMDRIGPERIAAWPKAVDEPVLDQVAADGIADDDGHNQVERPYPAFFAKVDRHKDK